MRDEKLDILRFVGLALVILAHVGPTALVLQLRNFDVPLMVLVSGASFSLSFRAESYVSYMARRIRRLLFPVWVFLTVYFLFVSIAAYPIPLPGIEIIATSYLLLSGIGYVWIIRVFLLVAAASQVISRFSRSTPSHGKYFLALSAVYATYELARFVAAPYLTSTMGWLFESITFYLVPYALIFAVGLRLPELSRDQVLRLAAVALALFGILAIALFAASGTLVPTQGFKYPPTAYYLSYALGVSCITWLLAGKILSIMRCLRLSTPALFLARNSIWAYLWHIPLIAMFSMPFYLKYPLVLTLAALAVLLQVGLVRKVLLPRINNPSIRRGLDLLFTG